MWWVVGVGAIVAIGLLFCAIAARFDHESALMKQARQLNRDIAVEHDDPRQDYLTVQISRDVLEEFRAALARFDEEETRG